MSETHPVSDLLGLPTPCDVAWEDMGNVGDGDRVRHCARCAHDVHDISALSLAEVKDLLETTDFGVCVSFLVDRDGNMVVREEHDGARRRLPMAQPPLVLTRSRVPRALSSLAAVAAASAGLGLVAGCASHPAPDASPVASAGPESASASAAIASSPPAAPSASAPPPDVDPLASAVVVAVPVPSATPAPSASAAACRHDGHRRLGGAPVNLRHDKRGF